MSQARRRLAVLFLACGLGGCALLRAGVDAGAPGPTGGPRDPVDTGLGMIELAGGSGALGLAGALAAALAAAVRRGRALRAVAAGVEAGADPETKAAIASEVARVGGGATLDAAIAASCGAGALGASRRTPGRRRRRSSGKTETITLPNTTPGVVQTFG